jgi:hypothetical protein
MDSRQREKRKELEQLKWDYWMQSDKFISFWTWMHSIGSPNKQPLPDQFEPTFDTQKRKIRHPMFHSTRDYWYYFMYRDHKEASFEEYWSFMMNEVWCVEDENEKLHKRVEDYREHISSDIDDVVEKFKREKHREPTIDELKIALVYSMMRIPFVYLEIFQFDFTFAEADRILKEVSQILKKRIPRTKPEIIPLRKYLEALILRRKGYNYRDLFEKLEGNKHYQDPVRVAKKYVANAKTVIRNLENNKRHWWI